MKKLLLVVLAACLLLALTSCNKKENVTAEASEPAPKEDDQDYYTYSWGLTVWIASAKEQFKNQTK